MTNLNSERLRIEPLRAEHARMVLLPLQSPALYTYLPEDPPSEEDLQRRYAFLEGGLSPDGEEAWLNWVAFLHDTTTPVGTFQATLPGSDAGPFAYMVFPEFWRQGFAREMAIAVISHLFETRDIPGLYAEMDTRNAASIGLVESLGLTRTGTRRGADVFKGATSDEHRYALSREAWEHRDAIIGDR